MRPSSDLPPAERSSQLRVGVPALELVGELLLLDLTASAELPLLLCRGDLFGEPAVEHAVECVGERGGERDAMECEGEPFFLP